MKNKEVRARKRPKADLRDTYRCTHCQQGWTIINGLYREKPEKHDFACPECGQGELVLGYGGRDTDYLVAM